MAKKNEGNPFATMNDTTEPEKHRGVLEAVAAPGWLFPDRRDLLVPASGHYRLSPNDIADLIRALELQEHLMSFLARKVLHADDQEALRDSRATQLIAALRVDLQALAVGTKSAGLQPNIHGQARNYKSAHPDYTLMQDEAAAAVELFVSLTGVQTRDEARKLVEGALSTAGVSFKWDAIEAREESLKQEGLYDRAVRRLLYSAFQDLSDDARPAVNRLVWVGACRTSADIAEGIRHRLHEVARIAQRLQPRGK
jgi:hypothetical protein